VCCAQVRESGGYVEVLLDVDAKTEFEKKYWKGVLDAQGKVASRTPLPACVRGACGRRLFLFPVVAGPDAQFVVRRPTVATTKRRA